MKDYEVIKPSTMQKKLNCEHDYEQTYQGWESETYVCKKCGDRYKLYYEDMK